VVVAVTPVRPVTVAPVLVVAAATPRALVVRAAMALTVAPAGSPVPAVLTA
jgi:hypothetical protein